jgi:hypothetical protein
MEQARSVLNAWSQINDELTFADLSFNTFTNVIKDALQAADTVESVEAKLTELRNQRDAQYAAAWNEVKRIRSGMKSFYGDDSSQYEMVGCTRRSDRKSPRRAAPPAEQA